MSLQKLLDKEFLHKGLTKEKALHHGTRTQKDQGRVRTEDLRIWATHATELETVGPPGC